MWRVDTSRIVAVFSGLSRFTDDLLDWAMGQDRSTPIDEIITRAASAPDPLGKVARSTSLKVWMARLVKCDELADVVGAYREMTTDYKRFLDQGAEVYRPAHPETWKLITECFNYLYEELGNSRVFQDAYLPGFGCVVRYTEPEMSMFGRPARFSEAYRKRFGELRRICPYCDCQQIQHLDYSSVDHFLARKFFPLLSLFGQNLVVACTRCNDRVKAAKLVGTDVGNTVNLPVFHPFFDSAAEHIRFEFSMDTVSPGIGLSVGADDGMDVIRVKNYLSLFEIGSLYRDHLAELTDEHEGLRRRVRNRFKSLGRVGRTDTIRQLLIDEIHDAQMVNDAKRGEFPRTKVRGDFLAFLEQHLEEEVDYILSLEDEMISRSSRNPRVLAPGA